MRVLCSGQGRKAFELLCGFLSDEEMYLDYCKDGLSLFQKVIYEVQHPEVIILDYALYKGFSDLIFNLLASKNLKIPVILLGEKVHGVEQRISSWISENEFQFDLQSLHEKVPLFKKISLALENEELKSLLYAPPAVKSDFTKNQSVSSGDNLLIKSTKENLLEHLLNQNSFPPSVSQLLSFMYKNRRREVSIDEISLCLNLSGKNEKSRRNITYAYISRLRKSLMTIPLCPLRLIRPRPGYYRLISN